MPFCRARLSAKRLIAGVGGYAPAPLPIAAPSKGGPPAAAPSFSLPMMRWATSHTASIAPIISCLPTTTSSSRHSSCAVTPGSTSAGSACLRTPNSDKPVSVGTMCFPCAIRKPCFFRPPMISARVAGVPMPLASFRRSRKTSAFAGLIGKRVASEKCTVVDNGTMPWRRGSLNVDDEGQPTQETVLIENGILKGYLSDKLSSKLMGLADTGNGRRESYEHIPMPRMTNTYMLAGQDDPADIIRSVKNGVYAVNFGGGQVDITNGKFVFSASEAYLIENGQITAPIKGATLIGNGPDVLTRVSMVGNDLKLDEGVGTCGKDGQSVPVGVGIPTIKIDRLTVGGTAKRETGGFMQ